MVTELKKSSARTDAFPGVGTFYVEERRGAISGGNQSLLYDEAGRPAGALFERSSFATRLSRVFLKPSLLPFCVELRDNNGRTVAAVRRGWTILSSRIEIVDSHESVIGSLKHKENARRPRLKVFNSEGKKIGEITGAKSARDMNIIDREYTPLGQIIECAPETTPGETRGKDTFFVRIDGAGVSEQERNVLLIVSLAINRLLEHN